MVYDINSDDVNALSSEFIEFDGKLYFSGNDGIHGNELWMYDGINDPSMVANINTDPITTSPDVGASLPGHYAVYKDGLYFTAYTRQTLYSLYKLGRFPTGVENVDKVGHVQVYPIPANKMIHFELELKNASPCTIILTDVAGREVYTSSAHFHPAGKVTLDADVSDLFPGNLFLSHSRQRWDAAGKR